MIKIGSRVKFMHSTGAGIVCSIDGDLAQVEVDGFEIPVLISDLLAVSLQEERAAVVKIGPDEPSSTPGESSKPRATVAMGQRYGKVIIEDDYIDQNPIDVTRLKQQYAEQVTQNVIAGQKSPHIVVAAPYQKTEYDIKIAFLPIGKDAPELSDLEMHLINDSSYELNYCIGIWKNDYVETVKVGKIEADRKVLIKKFLRSSFSHLQTLYISLQPFKPLNFTPQPVEDFDLELHPLKFVRPNSYVENDFFDEKAFLFSLTDNNTVELEKETPLSTQLAEKLKASAPNKQVAKKANKKPSNEIEVIDLHIENILDNWKELQSGEVLEAQLSRFTIALDGAIRTRQQGRIVFIHGVGKGKLKYELKKLLGRKYSQIQYQDASFEEYGYGAIMVML